MVFACCVGASGLLVKNTHVMLTTVCVCVYLCASFLHAECKHPPLSSYSPLCCYGDASLATVLQWSPLTLVGDLWHLGHGQSQKVSDGHGATRALPRLAHACCPLFLQRSPRSQFAPLISICYRAKTISCRRFIALFYTEFLQVSSSVLTARQGSIL